MGSSFDVVCEPIRHSKDSVKPIRYRRDGPDKVQCQLIEPVFGNRHSVKESGGSLSGRLVSTATDARSDVKVDIAVKSRPVTTHEGIASVINTKVVAQIVVMKLERFLMGQKVIGWNAEATLKEKEAIFELKKGVSFRVSDDGGKELIFWIRCPNV